MHVIIIFNATDDDGSCYFISVWYADVDGDGLGDANDTANACDQPDGYVADNSDLCPFDIENVIVTEMEFVKAMKFLVVLMQPHVIIMKMQLKKIIHVHIYWIM